MTGLDRRPLFRHCFASKLAMRRPECLANGLADRSLESRPVLGIRLWNSRPSIRFDFLRSETWLLFPLFKGWCTPCETLICACKYGNNFMERLPGLEVLHRFRFVANCQHSILKTWLLKLRDSTRQGRIPRELIRLPFQKGCLRPHPWPALMHLQSATKSLRTPPAKPFNSRLKKGKITNHLSTWYPYYISN